MRLSRLRQIPVGTYHIWEFTSRLTIFMDRIGIGFACIWQCLAGFCFALVAILSKGFAMNVSLDGSYPGAKFIVLSGNIDPGDCSSISSAIVSAPRDRRIVGMVVNSNGGNIVEAKNIASGVTM